MDAYFEHFLESENAADVLQTDGLSGSQTLEPLVRTL